MFVKADGFAMAATFPVGFNQTVEDIIVSNNEGRKYEAWKKRKTDYRKHQGAQKMSEEMPYRPSVDKRKGRIVIGYWKPNKYVKQISDLHNMITEDIANMYEDSFPDLPRCEDENLGEEGEAIQVSYNPIIDAASLKTKTGKDKVFYNGKFCTIVTMRKPPSVFSEPIDDKIPWGEEVKRKAYEDF